MNLIDKLKERLNHLDFKNKRALVRVDLNVPITNNTITSDLRLQQTITTIDYIIENGGTITLATHMGRPTAGQPLAPHESTRILVSWFKQKGYDVSHHPEIGRASTAPTQLTLLENLRSYPGELSGDATFAQQLSEHADLYVNDAFSLLHRTDTSVTLICDQFADEQRACGLGMLEQLRSLDEFMNASESYTLILGGTKKEKLRTLPALISHQRYRPDTILLCGLMGINYLDPDNRQLRYEIKACAEKYNCELILPDDYIVLHSNQTTAVASDKLATDETPIDIGPVTLDFYLQKILKSKHIVVNGTPGHFEIEQGKLATKKILHAAIQRGHAALIGGGDTNAALQSYDFSSPSVLRTTGGGALLKLLSCNDWEHELTPLIFMMRK